MSQKGNLKPEIWKALHSWIKYAQFRANKQEIEIFQAGRFTFVAKKQNYQPPATHGQGRHVESWWQNWESRCRLCKKTSNTCTTKFKAVIYPDSTSASGKNAANDGLHTKSVLDSIATSWSMPSRFTMREMCQAKKVTQQIIAELTAVRFRPARPFNAVGIDLGGPFYVKNTDKLNLNTRSKASIPECGSVWVYCNACRALESSHGPLFKSISASISKICGEERLPWESILRCK